METTPKPNDKTVIDAHEKILEYFDVDEILSVMATTVGMCELMAKYIFQECNYKKVPASIKYAILQHANIYVFLGKIVKGEIQRPSKNFEHMPTAQGDWCSDEDAEKRLIYVVKGLHEQLKKEGKIE